MMRAVFIACLILLSSTFAFYTEDGPVTILTEKNFKSLVLDSGDVWMVEFFAPWCGHCKAMKDEWIKAAGSMTGIVHFGAVDATVEQSLASRYQIQGYPTIKIFNPLNDAPTDYQNQRDAKSFCKAAFSAAKSLVSARLSGKTEMPKPRQQAKPEASEEQPEQPKAAKAPKPAEVKEITTQSQFTEACVEATCMLLIVPDIRDSSKSERESLIATVKAVADAQVSGLFEYGWIVGGSQYELEQKLNLGFGYPAVVAISGNKGRYAVQTGAFTEHNLNVFVRGLQTGSVRTKTLPELPAFVEVEPWDGKDAPVVEEEEDDYEDEI